MLLFVIPIAVIGYFLFSGNTYYSLTAKNFSTPNPNVLRFEVWMQSNKNIITLRNAQIIFNYNRAFLNNGTPQFSIIKYQFQGNSIVNFTDTTLSILLTTWNEWVSIPMDGMKLLDCFLTTTTQFQGTPVIDFSDPPEIVVTKLFADSSGFLIEITEPKGHIVLNNLNPVKTEPGLIENFILEQNYPNPFNPSTTIKFSILKRDSYSLVIYDILGREIKNLFKNININTGKYEYNINEGLTSGTYFYRLFNSEVSQIRKMEVVK